MVVANEEDIVVSVWFLFKISANDVKSIWPFDETSQ